MSIRKNLIKLFNKYNLPIDLLDNYEEFGVKNGKVFYQQNGIKDKYIKFNSEFGIRLHKDRNKKIRLQLIKYNSNPIKKVFFKNISKHSNSEYYNILYNNHQLGGAETKGQTKRETKGETKGDNELENKINEILPKTLRKYKIQFTNADQIQDEKLLDEAVDILLPEILEKLINKRN